MKRVLVDKNNEIVYEGVNAKEVLRILNADIYSVSEEDEVKYGESFRQLLDEDGDCKHGELKYEVHFNLKFTGIDDWNRPIFTDIDSNVYFGDVNKLWVFQELGVNNENVNKYYKDNPDNLEFFGYDFNCEPHGGLPSNFKLNIIDNEQ